MINCSIYERIFKCFDEDGDGKLGYHYYQGRIQSTT
ncbi:hypothetical protein CK203_028493 [Vitis vinifera]|uniref:EF-hand domain-containing protein n=1 Tax=Vitis vinifera TaxID=29760 RepID=A0A438I289_VITVI|nr:hypothetical protein CK203_028493 [Vitis vinifera]